ncbi:peroxiredoxin-like 2A [Coregonus clupeaformis]|uniref:peroxiredoxin-like 2A n=1 Tax=Coregonus clupeaformis TaxID=59861 RepID=UPI001BDF751A|nr:peroxiredoxin-like 2A [Coregonus clupeaformis]XP_041755781.1 peroxiredoxin-like 2A [Coregonus clupeaformis]XP_041755788.1 peroxiredoxin-like 2A [Coregonus clupeaformis]
MVTSNQALKAVGLFIAYLLKSITDLFLTKPLWANLKVLEETDFKTTGGIYETYKAKALWEKTGAVIMVVRRPGCLLCREEAIELSSLKPQLEELGVPLLAVVKENIGQELDAFKTFFTGEVYVDQKRALYGPVERWMFLSALLRIGVWRSLWRAYRKGCTGNIIKGEGLVLGGVFVIGPKDQGILLEHREKEFGDKVNLLAVLRSARKIQDGLATAK